MKNKISFILLIGLFITVQTTAQTAPGYSVGSTVTPGPGVSNLNDAGQKDKPNGISPDLYTGTVDVNVPIYDYSIDGLDLGVSLSYNTLGIKVDQIASSVGLGWNLNAGGYITRQVNGIEDETTYPAVGNTIMSNSNAYHEIPELRGTWVDKINLPLDVSVEQEPDVFNAVFGGRSITFLLYYPDYSTIPEAKNMIRTATMPKSDVHVDILFDTSTMYNNPDIPLASDNRLPANTINQVNQYDVLGFKITDEKGNQFWYGAGDVETKKYQDPYYKTFTNSYPIDRWVLQKVITYTGAEIDYHYNNYPVNYALYRDQETQETSDPYNYYTQSTGNVDVPAGIHVTRDSIIYWDGSIAHVSEIDYPNGVQVHFHLGDEENNGTAYANQRLDIPYFYALEKISIEGKYDNTVKNDFTYKFNYSYFNSDGNNPEVAYGSASTGADPTNYRLKLNSIDKIGTDNITTQQYYSFGYAADYILPPRLSTKQDCYGYSNGQSPFYLGVDNNGNPLTQGIYDSLTNLGIPLHNYYEHNSSGTIIKTITYGTNRGPSIAYAQSGVLNKITNDLGGTKWFHYKANVLSNPGMGNSQYANTGRYYYSHSCPFGTTGPDDGISYAVSTDGLCIDYISSSDGYSSNDTTTTYYDFNDGDRFFVGGYFWYPTVVYDASNIQANNDIGTCAQWVYTNSFVNPLDGINGAYHGYSEVNVTTKGYNQEILSHKQYKFTNVNVIDGEIDSSKVNNEDDLGPQSTYSAKYLPSGSSRICTRWGLLTHTMPRLYMQKHLLGLPVEIDDFDKDGNLVSITTNLYDESMLGIGRSDGTSMASNDYNLKELNASRNFSVTSLLGNPDEYPSSTVDVITGNYISFPNAIALLKQQTTTNFIGSGSMSTTRKFYYDKHDRLTYETWNDSKGDSYARQHIYDYVPYTQAYGSLANNNTTYYQDHYELVFPEENILWKAVPGSDNVIVNDDLIKPVYTSNTTSTYSNTNIPNNNGINIWGINNGLTGINFQTYQKVRIDAPKPQNQLTAADWWNYKVYSVFNDHKDVLQTDYNNALSTSSAIWDTRIDKKVAEVDNAPYASIAYTSFEGPFNNAPDEYNKGQWMFNPQSVVAGSTTNVKPMTGRYYYSLTSDNTTYIKSLNPIAKNTTYLLSFWCNGVTPHVQLTPSNPAADIALTLQNQVGDWKLYTAYVTGQDQNLVIFIDGVGSSGIDELRLCPATAAMTTYTYEPLLGVSSKCDERNNILYYEYDPMGNLTTVKDINGNILSLSKYTVQDNDN